MTDTTGIAKGRHAPVNTPQRPRNGQHVLWSSEGVMRASRASWSVFITCIITLPQSSPVSDEEMCSNIGSVRRQNGCKGTVSATTVTRSLCSDDGKESACGGCVRSANSPPSQEIHAPTYSVDVHDCVRMRLPRYRVVHNQVGYVCETARATLFPRVMTSQQRQKKSARMTRPYRATPP